MLESSGVAGHLLCSLRLRAAEPHGALPHREAPLHYYGALGTGDWMDPGQWVSRQAYNSITLLPYWITPSATFLAVLPESIDNTDTGKRGRTEVLYRVSPRYVPLPLESWWIVVLQLSKWPFLSIHAITKQEHDSLVPIHIPQQIRVQLLKPLIGLILPKGQRVSKEVQCNIRALLQDSNGGSCINLLCTVTKHMENQRRVEQSKSINNVNTKLKLQAVISPTHAAQFITACGFTIRPKPFINLLNDDILQPL